MMPNRNSRGLTRRELLKRTAGLAGVMALQSAARPGLCTPPRRELIASENAKEGTTDWLLTSTRVLPENRIRSPWIEGYCSKTSARAGETIQFMVSTNPPSNFVIDLYRLGYYRGRGGRHLERLGPFQGLPHDVPDQGPQRVHECRWPAVAELRVPDDWVSGVYLGKLTATASGAQSYIIFIVRDDRECDFLFQCSDTTWAAYNQWPSRFSLYDHDSTPGWYLGPGVRVSWDRPYGRYRQIFDAPLSQGSGEFLLWEFPLAFWMEKHGFDLSYISNVDTHADGAGLLRGKTFLSVGHDEYWSLQMFHNVQQAVAEGMSAAFLSGNSCDGVIAFHENAMGTPLRSLSRVGKFGPRPAELKAHGDAWTAHGPNPALLMGARTTFPYNGSGDWTCANEGHWLFDGTGMKDGDAIPGLVGWEHHGEPADIPDLEIIARGPVLSHGRPQGVEYTSTIYPGPKENWVFNAATIWWADGLSAPPGYLRPYAHGSAPPGPDPRVQRITMNLFKRLSNK